LDELCDVAGFMKTLVAEHGVVDLCKGLYSSNLFYEPSTRTSSSFFTAMGRLGIISSIFSFLILGGNVLPILSEFSSVQKGETIEDTIKVLQNYVDVIVMRHPDIGSVARAASASNIPIINAGDGANEHPTQVSRSLKLFDTIINS
jgi:aspartate carbamoyltransferase catalytic subunit